MAVRIEVAPKVSDDELNALLGAAWEGLEPEHGVGERLCQHSLSYICAYDGAKLVGFVNLAWDGGVHGFILDTTVHPDYRRRGVGIHLVEKAVGVAEQRGLRWLHADYEKRLERFYAACGFQETKAGVMNLRRRRQ